MSIEKENELIILIEDKIDDTVEKLEITEVFRLSYLNEL